MSTKVSNSRAIISTIGQDRPGLVTELTALVNNCGLSVEDSRMAVLGGEFAALMSVTGSEQGLSQLETDLASHCADQAIESIYRRTTDRNQVQALPYWVTVTAMDHPGIVTRVANFFSDRGINILQLDTDAQPAPHTGTPMFNLSITIAVPANQNASKLRQQFEAFCEEEDLDGELGVAS